MSKIWFSADPGKTGALAVWQDKDLLQVVDYNKEKYKELLQTHKEEDSFLLCEKIDTVYQGVYSGFILGQRIGELRGATLMSNIEFISDYR